MNINQENRNIISHSLKGWSVQRLAYNGEFFKGKGISRSDLTTDGEDVILYGDIYTRYNISITQLEKKTSKAVASNSFKIQKGDLLFTGSGETRIDIGKCVHYKGKNNAFAGGDILIFRQNKFDSQYLSYVFNSSNINVEKARLCKGEIIKHIYSSQLRNIKFLAPDSLEDQVTISKFLDRKTSEIDSLIVKKQQLLYLFEEERKALINQLVTKGLNPDAEMKESGIELLGEIPNHWRRIKLKMGLSQKICDGPHETPIWQEEGIPFISAEAIQNNQIDLNRKRGFISIRQHSIYSKKSKVLKGDILFCKSGSTTGKSAMVTSDEEFGIWSPLAIIRANPNLLNNYYLLKVLQSPYFKTQVETSWSFGTQPNIGMGALENLWVTLPPMKEQIQICEELKANEIRIENVNAKLSKEISLLIEYKEAIINEVVTGKIKIN